MIDERELVRRAVKRLTPPEPAFDRMVRRRDRRRRNERIAAAIVGIAVFTAAIWIGATGGPFDRTTDVGTTPSPSRVPAAGTDVFGLPPKDAVPSSPVHGELVLTFWGRPTAMGGGLFRLWGYADGRLLWDREVSSEGESPAWTWLIEQRLTPAGMELLRSRIVGTGMFPHDLSFISDHGPTFGTFGIRVGGRFVHVDWTHPDFLAGSAGKRYIATDAQKRALARLDTLFADPARGLPADAWEEERPQAYVASSYGVCYDGSLPSSPSLERLKGELRVGEPYPRVPSGETCSVVTTDQARTLTRVLEDAGFLRGGDGSQSRLQYQSGIGPSRNLLTFWFEPVLPHGRFQVCAPCG